MFLDVIHLHAEEGWDSTLTARVKGDRPLDCWKEVEAFKDEVNKLERVS